MKKIISVFLAVCMAAAMLPSTANAAPAGTAITTADEFAGMTPDGTYYLANDINISSPYSSPFTGTFDGKGRTINAVIAGGPGNSGVFSEIGSGGAVKNLQVTGNVLKSASYSGGVAGINNGAIKNCIVTANVDNSFTTGNTHVGGIAGYNGGTITNCIVTGSISGFVNGYDCIIGGIAGENQGSISFCYSYNNAVSAAALGGPVAACGGIAGMSSQPVNNCVALNNSIGAFGALEAHAARVVGRLLAPGVADCYGKRDMSGGTNSGDTTSANGADVELSTATADSDWWNDTAGWTIGDPAAASESSPWIWDSVTNMPGLIVFKTYTVLFNSTGGSDVDNQTVAHGGKAAEPGDPPKAAIPSAVGIKMRGMPPYGISTPTQ